MWQGQCSWPRVPPSGSSGSSPTPIHTQAKSWPHRQVSDTLPQPHHSHLPHPDVKACRWPGQQQTELDSRVGGGKEENESPVQGHREGCCVTQPGLHRFPGKGAFQQMPGCQGHRDTGTEMLPAQDLLCVAQMSTTLSQPLSSPGGAPTLQTMTQAQRESLLGAPQLVTAEQGPGPSWAAPSYPAGT